MLEFNVVDVKAHGPAGTPPIEIANGNIVWSGNGCVSRECNAVGASPETGSEACADIINMPGTHYYIAGSDGILRQDGDSRCLGVGGQSDIERQ